MAKYREEICEKYICVHQCTEDKDAVHESTCQKCSKYVPRVRRKHLNKKKIELDKIRTKEFRKGEC